MGRIRNAVTWGLAAGLTAYTSLYAALNTHVIYDYTQRHSRWLHDNVRNELVIKRFSATLDNKIEKELAFAGETHDYNYKESDFARDLIKQFNLVLSEGGYTQQASFIDNAFLAVVSPMRDLVEGYMALADGRFASNLDIEDLAYQNGIPVLYLENDTAGGASTFTIRQKTRILWTYFYGAALAPYLYPQFKELEMQETANARQTPEFNSVGEDEAGKIVNVGPRNILMSNQILKYLRERPESRILVVVGKGHLDGLIGILKENTSIKMETAK